MLARVFVVALSVVLVGPAVAGDSSSRIHVVQAQNPCAAKNPAAGGSVDSKLITRPAGTRLFAGKQAELIKEGERLWNDTTLSTNGLACQTCHRGNASFNATFTKPYPHAVAMAKERAGLEQIHLDEMVQICMVVPMATKPLPWASKELAALTAYARELQKTFKPAAAQDPAANPCATRDPGAAKNPCAVRIPRAPTK
jgi:cytochrome c